MFACYVDSQSSELLFFISVTNVVTEGHTSLMTVIAWVVWLETPAKFRSEQTAMEPGTSSKAADFVSLKCCFSSFVL